MLPDELQQFRVRLYLTATEFAEVLSRVREAEMSAATIQGWESGRNAKRVPVYKTDRDAIELATRPHSPHCQCGALTVVRKNNSDLCADCAIPPTWHTAQKLVVGV